LTRQGLVSLGQRRRGTPVRTGSEDKTAEPGKRGLLARKRDGEVRGEAEQIINEKVVVRLDELTLTDPRTKRGNLGVIDRALRGRRCHPSVPQAVLLREIGMTASSHYSPNGLSIASSVPYLHHPAAAIPLSGSEARPSTRPQ
jgi:hypothetical protein